MVQHQHRRIPEIKAPQESRNESDLLPCTSCRYLFATVISRKEVARERTAVAISLVERDDGSGETALILMRRGAGGAPRMTVSQARPIEALLAAH
jgi:hypothetical protein